MDYILENDYLKLTVSSKGAEVTSVLRKCDGVEHVWQADPAVWGCHAPILFPHCGKVVDGVIHAKGRDYPAKQHGFARDMEHILVSRSANSLSLALESNVETQALFPYAFRLISTFALEGPPLCHTLTLALESDTETQALFPYAFRLVSTFTLDGPTLCHTLTVENGDQEEMPFGIGFHPGFAVPFDDQHKLEDYELRFEKMESPLCINNLPHGLMHGNFYYLGSNIIALPITKELFANDSHCMTNLVSGTLGIYEKDTGRAVVCDIREFPYTLLWSMPGFEPRFVCIEPWHSLPSPEKGSTEWLDKPAAAILAPGESWSTTLRTSFAR